MIYRKGNLPDINEVVTFQHDGGSKEIRERVEYWLKFFKYNFGFKIVKSDNAKLRIRYSEDHWNLSYTGNYARNMPFNQAPWTMHFKPSSWRYKPYFLDFVIQHELFHWLLGAEHEHLNPLNGVKWDEEKRIEHLKYHGYTQEQIDIIIEGINPDYYEFTEMNPLSVTAYHVSCALTLDHEKCGNRNYNTSLKDLEEWAYALGSPKRDFILPKYWHLVNDAMVLE